MTRICADGVTDAVTRADEITATSRRIERWLASREEEGDDALARGELLLATLSAASLRARIADGPEQGEPWRRAGDRVDPEVGPKIQTPHLMCPSSAA
jgi:hypothetical protein